MTTQREIQELQETSYQLTLSTIESRITTLSSACKKFKIGKTGMSKDDRFNEPDYRDTYSDIEVLHSSDGKDVISRLEHDLILRFENDEKCDNKRETDQDDMRESGRYILYMVYI